MTLFRLISFLLLTLFAGGALADELHYVNKRVGERAALMGGAFTAVADDPSACYYNPAGIVRVANESVSLSADLVQNETETYKNFFSDRDVVLRSTHVVPTFWGLVRPLGSGRVCFSVTLPDATNLQIHQFFPGVVVDGVAGDFRLDFIKEDRTYLIGPGYAHRLSSRMALGGSVLLVYRKNIQEVRALFSSDNDQVIDETFTSSDSSGYGLMAAIGGMADVTEAVSLGLAYRLPTRISSDRSESEIQFSGPQGAISRTGIERERQVQITEKMAPSLVLGTAYHPSPSTLLSMDLAYHAPMNYESGVETIRRRGVLNGSVGGAFQLTPTWQLLGGLFTDRSAALGEADQIHLYGTAVGFRYDTPRTSTSVGLIGAWGDGTYTAIDGARRALIWRNLAMILSGSVRF